MRKGWEWSGGRRGLAKEGGGVEMQGKGKGKGRREKGVERYGGEKAKLDAHLASARMAELKASVEVRRVSKRYGSSYALKEVSFRMERGEIEGVLGANGAGKSRLLRMLSGLMDASSGTIGMGGVNILHSRTRLKKVPGGESFTFSQWMRSHWLARCGSASSAVAGTSPAS